MLSPPAKARWTCRQCMKNLCSKRSYDEHMNIHNNRRPFICDDCNYAAASQMTLTRHRQRRHTPRQEWHYQCPYCAELYMEPASYRQHVLARHYGQSATFGCSYGDCPFKCKSSKAFRDHLLKHQAVILSRTNTGIIQGRQFDMENLVGYMVDDECGVGNLSTRSSKFAVLYGRTNAADRVTVSAACTQNVQVTQLRKIGVLNSGNTDQNRRQRGRNVTWINVDELLDNSEMVPLVNAQLITQQKTKATYERKESETQCQQSQQENDEGTTGHCQNIEVEPVEEQQQCFEQVHQATDWIIETEVVIEEQMGPQMPDGQTDDFGLD